MKKIQLTRGKVALVDDEDYGRLEDMGKWQFEGRYATKGIWIKQGGSSKYKSIRMHRFVLDAPDGMEVDHINGNKLDNQKANLRVCTKSENQFNRGKYKTNTSGFKGVTWHKNHKKWYAAIRVNKAAMHLGHFDCPIEAARAYNSAALIHHGKFALLNEIPS